MIFNYKIFSIFPDHKKFTKDVSYNMFSFLILGITGILLNILIGKYYGPTALGVFNQVYAVFVLFSQMAAGGIHLSVVKHLAQINSPEQEQKRKTAETLIPAVILTSLLAGAVCAGLWISHEFIGKILQSPAVSEGILMTLPGLWCFALNKVFMASLNGQKRMKEYAVFQSFRYIFMLGFLIFLICKKQESQFIPFLFSFAEITLFVILGSFHAGIFRFLPQKNFKSWIQKHFSFGLKSFLSGIFMEINTRVDILILGIFMADETVGIYSFAAILVQGMIEILMVLRTNLNPVLTNMFFHSSREELQIMITNGVRKFYKLFLGIALISIALFPLLINVFLPSGPFLSSWPIFCILTGGVLIISGYLPFSMILLQAGYPEKYTAIILIYVAANIFLNLALIPIAGGMGAAVATAISFFVYKVSLKTSALKVLKLQI